MLVCVLFTASVVSSLCALSSPTGITSVSGRADVCPWSPCEHFPLTLLHSVPAAPRVSRVSASCSGSPLHRPRRPLSSTRYQLGRSRTTSACHLSCLCGLSTSLCRSSCGKAKNILRCMAVLVQFCELPLEPLSLGCYVRVYHVSYSVVVVVLMALG